MIKRFICWAWGHKTLLKVATGNSVEMTDRLTGGLMTIPLVKWEKNKFCTRCGAENIQGHYVEKSVPK